jgi:PKD repeat protein
MRTALGAICVTAMLAAIAVPAAMGVSGEDLIATVAGTGTYGYSGDGGPATAAQLDSPHGVAVDRQGNLYIADYGNNRVRKVARDGRISTVAGNGKSLFSGDGGPATAAQLYAPSSVAVDGQGNLYVTDFGNRRVRKVTTSGVISTVAGTGTLGFSGDGGPATAAELAYPLGLAVDRQGNLYIADYGAQRVRKVSTAGVISTVAGTGTPGSAGDGGPATAAQLNTPIAVAVDAQGSLYIADSGNNRIRKVMNGTISTVAGTGTAGFTGDGGEATAAQLNGPAGVVVGPSGTLYIVDKGNQRVRKVANGTISTVAGTGAEGSFGDGDPASGAQLNWPHGVALDGRGDLYVVELYGQRVREIENRAPAASFSVSKTGGRAPLAVSFDGSASSDPDGQVSLYAWSFGDGATAVGPTAAHVYTKPGTYKSVLTVTDDGGATSAVTRTFTVQAAPAKLSVSGFTVGRARAGQPFTVAFTVKRAGWSVAGSVSCRAKLNGRSLGVSSRSTSSSERIACTWTLPRSSSGGRLTGSISMTSGGATVSRSFSVVVR